jgi:hypothetical protein
MSASKLPDFFSPFLGAAIATATTSKGVALSLALAFVGGGVGWLGKHLLKLLFFYIKGKYTNEDKG